MPKKDPKPSKRRKNIADIVTWDAIKAENRKLNAQLRGAEQGAPAPKSEAEERRRGKMVENAHLVAGTAALTYLHERDPAAYWAIVRSLPDYLSDLIHKGQAEFVIRPSKPTDGFFNRALTASVLDSHHALMERLQPVWRVKPKSSDEARYGNVVSQKGRFGKPQLVGLRRRELLLEARAAAIDAALKELLTPEIVESTGIDATLVQRWARQRTASAASQEILAHLLGGTPRQMQALIIRAGKQSKEADKHMETLKHRGWRAAGAQSGAVTAMFQPGLGLGLLQLVPRAEKRSR